MEWCISTSGFVSFVTNIERNLVVRSDITVGTELPISVLFPGEFALASLGVLTEIIRKDDRWEEDIRYHKRMRLTRIGKENHLKLRYLLKGIQADGSLETNLQTILFCDGKRHKPTFAG